MASVLKNYWQVRLFDREYVGQVSAVGYKGKIFPYRHAQKILKFLKARGHKGYLAPVQVRET